jgi:hypothetical protein
MCWGPCTDCLRVQACAHRERQICMLAGHAAETLKAAAIPQHTWFTMLIGGSYSTVAPTLQFRSRTLLKPPVLHADWSCVCVTLTTHHTANSSQALLTHKTETHQLAAAASTCAAADRRIIQSMIDATCHQTCEGQGGGRHDSAQHNCSCTGWVNKDPTFAAAEATCKGCHTPKSVTPRCDVTPSQSRRPKEHSQM